MSTDMLPSAPRSTMRQRCCLVSYVSMSRLWLAPDRLTPRSQRVSATHDHVVKYWVVLPSATELQFQRPDILATSAPNGSAARAETPESIRTISRASIEAGLRSSIVSYASELSLAFWSRFANAADRSRRRRGQRQSCLYGRSAKRGLAYIRKPRAPIATRCVRQGRVRRRRDP